VSIFFKSCMPTAPNAMPILMTPSMLPAYTISYNPLAGSYPHMLFSIPVIRLTPSLPHPSASSYIIMSILIAISGTTSVSHHPYPFPCADAFLFLGNGEHTPHQSPHTRYQMNQLILDTNAALLSREALVRGS